jgi:hypothetical protein
VPPAGVCAGDAGGEFWIAHATRLAGASLTWGDEVIEWHDREQWVGNTLTFDTAYGRLGSISFEGAVRLGGIGRLEDLAGRQLFVIVENGITLESRRRGLPEGPFVEPRLGSRIGFNISIRDDDRWLWLPTTAFRFLDDAGTEPGGRLERDDVERRWRVEGFGTPTTSALVVTFPRDVDSLMRLVSR